MDRQAKIKLLTAYSEGLLPADYLQPPKTYVFFQHHSKSVYLKDGEEYTEEEYRAFCSDIDAKRKLYQSIGPDLKTDEVITVVYKEGATIL